MHLIIGAAHALLLLIVAAILAVVILSEFINYRTAGTIVVFTIFLGPLAWLIVRGIRRRWYAVKVYFGFAEPEDPAFIGEPLWGPR